MVKEMMESKDQNGVVLRAVLAPEEVLLQWAEQLCRSGGEEPLREELFYYEGFNAEKEETFVAQLERELKADFADWPLPDFVPAPIGQLVTAIESMMKAFETAVGVDEAKRWKIKIDLNQTEGKLLLAHGIVGLKRG